MTRSRALVVAALAFGLAACGDRQGSVGEFSNDLLGNEIMVEAFADPDISGVVCHVAYFDRSALDRIRQGNWFESPSNSTVSCTRIGDIDLAGLQNSRAGEEIYSERQSLFFKNVAVRRIIDLEHRTLVYVSHSRELVEASAKIDMSTIALTPEELAAAQR